MILMALGEYIPSCLIPVKAYDVFLALLICDCTSGVSCPVLHSNPKWVNCFTLGIVSSPIFYLLSACMEPTMCVRTLLCKWSWYLCDSAEVYNCLQLNGVMGQEDHIVSTSRAAGISCSNECTQSGNVARLFHKPNPTFLQQSQSS